MLPVNSQGSAVQGRWSLPKCCSIWLIVLSWISVRVLSSWQCRIAGGKDQAAVWSQQRLGTCCFVLVLWLLLDSSVSICSKSTSANEMVFVIKWRERERERERVLSWSLAWLQQNLETIDRLLFEGEARLAKFQHPDPYIGTHSQTFLLFYHLFWCWRVGS